MKNVLKSILVGSLALSSAAVQPSFAADGSWNVNLASSWITAGSWAGSVIPGATSDDANLDTATFGFTLTVARTITVDTNRSIKYIDFSNGNASTFGYTLSGGSLLLNNGGSITSSGSSGAHTDTVASTMQLRGDGGAFTFGANSTLNTRLLTISGGITGVSTSGNTTTLTLNGANTGLNTVSGIVGDGSGGGKVAIVKDGAGTWRLSGVNTYTGATSVQAGTLTVGHASALTSTSGISLASGARLDVTATNADISKLSTANGGSGVIAGSFLRLSSDLNSGAAGATNGVGTIFGTVELNNGNPRPKFGLDFGGGSKLINLVTSTLSPSPGTITLSGDSTFEAAVGTLTIGSTITSSTAGLKTLTLTGANTGVYNGGFQNGSGSIALVKEGVGSWNIGNASNSSVLLGGVFVNEGSLTLGRSVTANVNTTLASDIPNIYLGDSAVANAKSATMIVNSSSRAINLDSAITVRSGSSGVLKITRSGSTLELSNIRGGIVLNNNLTLDGAAGLAVTTIGISGNGSLTTDNTLWLNAVNTYSGSTTVNSGTTGIGVDNALPETVLAVNSGATFDLSRTNNGATPSGSTVANFNQRVSGLNGAGTVQGLGFDFANSATIGNRTLTLDGTSGTYAFSGTIRDRSASFTTATNTLSLVKSGGSVQTLSGANTHSGSTTVNGGTLLISGTIANTSGVAVNGGTFNYTNNSTALDRAVTVAGGNFKYNSTQAYTGALTFTSGTVSGSGNLSNTALTIGSGQTLAPGNSPGTLSTGAQTWANGGSYLWEINALATSTIPGSEGSDPGWDFANITGVLTITAGVGQFNVNVDSLLALDNWNSAGTYQWRIATASGGVTGFASNIFNIDTSAFSDQNTIVPNSFSVTNVGNDVFLNYAAVPEPSTYALFGMGLAALWVLRRKKSA